MKYWRRVKQSGVVIALFCAFGIILAVSGAVAMTVSLALNAAQRNSEALVNDMMPRFAAAKNIQLQFLQLQAAYFTSITGTSDEVRLVAEKQVEEIRTYSTSALGDIEKGISGEQEKELVVVVRSGFEGFEKLDGSILNFAHMNMQDAATGMLANAVEAGQAGFKATEELVRLVQDRATTMAEQANKSAAEAKLLVLAMIGVLMGIVIAASIYVLLQIARPVRRIIRSMNDLVAGDVHRPIPYVARADEIGLIAGAVEIFRKAAIKRLDIEQQAEQARNSLESERVKLAAEAERSANEKLAKATSGLAAGLRSLAAGFLDFQLVEPFSAEFDALREDLNAAVESLCAALTSVAISTEQIAAGATTLRDGISSLSIRTERQAGSLEETSRALNEITDTVRSDSDRTMEIERIVAAAASDAKSTFKTKCPQNRFRVLQRSSTRSRFRPISLPLTRA
ncbi:hypothetical protein DEM27_25800 [Metarhizobium album]|uniref:HAMP domain-containing protein n=1 Tax=Metarhizobium album TaxID=2182425 RepID=A0A2U2DJ88_9HYPH|nr:methyl-accepting chemotaxis protein [Rhizobium album]PWE53372.1 hypothetical protein DEM27_25800 [Rhizobium album]